MLCKVIEEEDKGSLTRRRVELVESLATPLSVEDRVLIQGELRVINAKIKALNTTAAAQLKAAADRRKVAGMIEARANAARSQAKPKSTSTWPSSAPGEPGFGDPINRESIAQREAREAARITRPDDDEDDDPGQTAAIDAWIVAVLKRGGVRARRAIDGNLDLIDAPAKWVAIVDALCSGIYAAARGQELPEVTAAPKEKRKTRR